MRSLGLFGGGRERLPALAFNTKDGNRQPAPFPDELPINRETLSQCAMPPSVASLSAPEKKHGAVTLLPTPLPSPAPRAVSNRVAATHGRRTTTTVASRFSLVPRLRSPRS